MNPLRDQDVLILGLGISGLAMARWCARQGARVRVADTRPEPPGLSALQAEVPGASFHAGSLAMELVQGTTVSAVFRSPGLAPDAVAGVWRAAQGMGLALGGELTLFSQALADLAQDRDYRPAVLGITGTNGKTTVTALTGKLVQRSGKSVVVAGNIGPTLLDSLAACLDEGSLPDVWVPELSSFQLESCDSFEPTAATVLNVTQDHLDWHASMEAYAAAKARIFGRQGWMVLNRDDPVVMAMRPPPIRARLQKPQERGMVTFGDGMPERPGDYGIEVVNGMAWLVRAHEADETRRRRKDDVEELHIQRLMPADALRIRGRHNALNALAALALGGAAGCSLASMLFGLRGYRGEPHRVESIGMVQDVEYFDDSKGTNVGATVAALTGLGSDRRVVLILGGEGKGQDFSPLVEPVTRHARAVILIGRDAPLIRNTLGNVGVPMFDAASMPEAVRTAAQSAQAGDAVLMSPACASFDMFHNYEHRADVFRAAVRELADAVGVELEGLA